MQDAPVSLVDPRNTKRFTDLLATSLSAGQPSTGGLKLPSWVQVVEKTRELYCQVRSQDRKGKPEGPLTCCNFSPCCMPGNQRSRSQLDRDSTSAPVELDSAGGAARASSRALRVLFLGCSLCGLRVGGYGGMVRSYTIAQTTLNSALRIRVVLGRNVPPRSPAGWVARAAGTSRAMRTGLLILYGLISYAPKLLRNPASPLYHDEFAHWRELTKSLPLASYSSRIPIISIIPRYPGLHAATAALVHATGLTIWQAGTYC